MVLLTVVVVDGGGKYMAVYGLFTNTLYAAFYESADPHVISGSRSSRKRGLFYIRI